MLQIKVSVYDHDRDSIPSRYLDGCLCTVAETVSAIGLAYFLRELSSRIGGASGHKAWIVINANDMGLVLHFMGSNVDFEFSRQSVLQDDAYCNGELPYDGIPELLAIMDSGNDPIVYLENVSLAIDRSSRD